MVLRFFLLIQLKYRKISQLNHPIKRHNQTSQLMNINATDNIQDIQDIQNIQENLPIKTF